MSRTSRFLDGVSLGYIAQALVMLGGLWLTAFLLDRVGQHDYGLWLVGLQIMVCLMLTDFGMVVLLQRETAYATGRAGRMEDAADLPFIIGRTARLVLWQVPVVAMAVIIVWVWMPAEWETLRWPLRVVLLAFMVMFPLRIFQAVLQGLQDLAFLGWIQIGSWLLSTAITVGLVLTGWGLYALAIGWMIAQVTLVAMGWYRVRTRFPEVLPASLPPVPWTTAQNHLSQGFWVSLAQLAQVMVHGADVLIIGTLLGPAVVVPFVCTGKLITTLANQPQILMQAAGPALSEMRVGEPRHRLFQVCSALSQAMLLVSGAIVCVVLATNQGFVGWWVGVDQYGGSTLTVVLLLNMLLRHWNTTAVYAIFCFGYERQISLTTLLDGFVTVCGAVLFVRQMGPIGAPLGALAGVCLVSLPGNLSALARENGVSVATLMSSLWPWFWRLCFLAGAASIVARVWLPNTFLALAVTAILTILIYGIVMLPAALRSPVGIYLRPRLEPIRGKIFSGLLAKKADV